MSPEFAEDLPIFGDRANLKVRFWPLAAGQLLNSGEAAIDPKRTVVKSANLGR